MALARPSITGRPGKTAVRAPAGLMRPKPVRTTPDLNERVFRPFDLGENPLKRSIPESRIIICCEVAAQIRRR